MLYLPVKFVLLYIITFILYHTGSGSQSRPKIKNLKFNVVNIFDLGPPLSPAKRSRPAPNSAGNTPVKGAAAQPKRPRKPRRLKAPPQTGSSSNTSATTPSVTSPRAGGPTLPPPPSFAVLPGPPPAGISNNPVPLGLLSISAPLPQAALMAPSSPPLLPIRLPPGLTGTSISGGSAPTGPLLPPAPTAGQQHVVQPLVPPPPRGSVHQFAAPTAPASSALPPPAAPRVIQYAPKQQLQPNHRTAVGGNMRMPGPATGLRPGSKQKFYSIL
jgi:hypothetical protein